MKKMLSLLLLLTFAAGIAVAQEEPIPPKRSRAVKVGLFGGYTPGWLFVDMKPVNDFLVGGNGAALKEGGVFMSGGAGAIYIMLIPNVRMGGMGMAGWLKSTALDLNGIRRDAEYSVGFGGLTIEYVWPIMERLDVAVGASLGGGSTTLTLRQSNGGSNTWGGEQSLFSQWTALVPPNTTRTLSGGFFVTVPSVNIEYALTGWLGVRLGASYVSMFAPSWEVDGNYDLIGVPGDVSGRGFMLQGGVFVGTY
jgi:hypothetical protein